MAPSSSPSPSAWSSALRSLGRTLGTGALQLLYPATCYVCGQPLAPDHPHFCPDCRADLFTDARPTCVRCAATLGPYSPTEEGCPTCRTERFAFERVVRLGIYRDLLRDVVLRMKHSAGAGLAEVMGERFAETAEARLRALGADLVVPVPLHWWRRWQRGYNQSEAVAEALSRRLGLPYSGRCLRRVRATPQQGLKSKTARRENVKDAFACRSRPLLTGRSVLLIDDVLTTGSTAHEAARALRRGGAKRVCVAVLARTENDGR